MIALVLFGVTGLIAAVRYALSRPPRTWRRGLEIFIQTDLVIMIGLGGLFAWSGHVFMADEVARGIGWATGSPFQFEVGVTNLAFGVLGLLCARYRGGFWLATAIGVSVFFLGAGWGHIQEITVHQNYAPFNAGIALFFADVFHPLFLLALLALHRWAGTKARSGDAEPVSEMVAALR